MRNRWCYLVFVKRWHFISSIPGEGQVINQGQSYQSLLEDAWNPSTKWDKHSWISLTWFLIYNILLINWVMLPISKVGLTSEKPFQGLMSWVWSLHPSPTPPFFLMQIFHSIVSAQGLWWLISCQYRHCLSESSVGCGVELWWLEWCRQNSFFSQGSLSWKGKLTATDTLWALQALPRLRKAQDQCKKPRSICTVVPQCWTSQHHSLAKSHP